MSGGDLPRLPTMALQDFLGLSVLVREFRLVRVPSLALTTAASAKHTKHTARHGTPRARSPGSPTDVSGLLPDSAEADVHPRRPPNRMAMRQFAMAKSSGLEVPSEVVAPLFLRQTEIITAYRAAITEAAAKRCYCHRRSCGESWPLFTNDRDGPPWSGTANRWPSRLPRYATSRAGFSEEWRPWPCVNLRPARAVSRGRAFLLPFRYNRCRECVTTLHRSADTKPMGRAAVLTAGFAAGRCRYRRVHHEQDHV